MYRSGPGFSVSEDFVELRPFRREKCHADVVVARVKYLGSARVPQGREAQVALPIQ